MGNCDGATKRWNLRMDGQGTFRTLLLACGGARGDSPTLTTNSLFRRLHSMSDRFIQNRPGNICRIPPLVVPLHFNQCLQLCLGSLKKCPLRLSPLLYVVIQFPARYWSALVVLYFERKKYFTVVLLFKTGPFSISGIGGRVFTKVILL